MTKAVIMYKAFLAENEKRLYLVVVNNDLRL